MRPDRHLLHHTGMTVFVPAEILKTKRCFALPEDLPIHERNLSRPVVEPISLEAVPIVLLEPAVGDSHRPVGFETRLAILHDKRSIDDGNPGREVAVVCKNRAAIADAEDVGDDFDAMLLADVSDARKPVEVVGRLPVEPIQTRGKHHAIETMGRGRLHDPLDVGHILVRSQ